MVLSIIIPVYKTEKYIQKTLDSIFCDSSYINDFEVIVINDGTPDNSMSIVNDYASKYLNLQIINQTNQGLSCARNAGIKVAKGDYLWFVDSDDWIEQGFITRVVPFLRDAHEDALMFRISEYDESTQECFRTRSFLDNQSIANCCGSDMLRNWLSQHIDITPIQIFLLKRTFVLENKLFFVPGIYHEDKEYAPRMLLSTEDVAYVPWINYCYLRRSSDSITTNTNLLVKRAKSYIKIYKLNRELSDKLPNNKRHLLSEYNCTVASLAWSLCVAAKDSNWRESIEADTILPLIKKDVCKNLFKRKKISQLFRQIIFLVSPTLLMKLGKGI